MNCTVTGSPEVAPLGRHTGLVQVSHQPGGHQRLLVAGDDACAGQVYLVVRGGEVESVDCELER